MYTVSNTRYLLCIIRKIILTRNYNLNLFLFEFFELFKQKIFSRLIHDTIVS